MKKILTISAVAIVAQIGLAAPASADTAALPFGGSATLTVPDVVLTPGGNCVSHYGTLTVTHMYDWDVTLTANGPTTWPASDFIYGDGIETRIVELQLCPSFDKPGLYTVSGLMSVYDSQYNSSEAIVSDQFTISNPGPVVVPTPVPVTPAPASPSVDVNGQVKHKMVTKGVRLTFRTKATPNGSATGRFVTWKVKADGARPRTITQGPNEVTSTTVKFTDGRKHIVKVFRNGSLVKSVTVRAG